MTQPINDDLIFENVKFYRETNANETYMVLYFTRKDGKGVALKVNRDNLVREIVHDFMQAVAEFTDSLAEGIRDSR
jgi:hypothetical protein